MMNLPWKVGARAVVGALSIWFSLSPAAQSATPDDPESSCASEWVYFGTQTLRPSEGVAGAHYTGYGIFGARFDLRTGHLTGLGSVAEIERPTWLLAHPSLPILYSVSELGNDGRSEASIFSLAVDAATGKLREVNKVGSGGGGATYMALDPASRTLFVANYGTGQVSALPIMVDGSLGAVAAVRRDYGFGPNPRQKSPHAHSVALDPSHHFVLVPDLGADRIFVYRFDPATRQLTQADRAYEPLPAGSGPRHLVFHPGGRFVILDTEFSAQIRTYRWDSHHGLLQLVQTLSTAAADYKGQNSAAEVAVSRDGRFVYVSNRGEDTVVVYSMNARTGMLTEMQRVSSQGKGPWGFGLDPSGHWMLVTNQASESIAVLTVDPKTGKLGATSESLSLPKPVSVTFLADQAAHCQKR
jgi:6-phosphogluconolactonase